jgi:hypothetical protein
VTQQVLSYYERLLYDRETHRRDVRAGASERLTARRA